MKKALDGIRKSRYSLIIGNEEHDMSGIASNTTRRGLAMARASRSLEVKVARGDVYNVVRVQKNGKLSKPDSYSSNLSEARANERQKELERLNPGSTFIVI